LKISGGGVGSYDGGDEVGDGGNNNDDDDVELTDKIV